jgi:hypothetical protein
VALQQEGKEEDRQTEETFKLELDRLMEEEDIKWQQQAKED